MNIKKIKAIRIIDSRGIPTIKTFVYTDNVVGYASVPSGTSSGKNEAFELRDNSKSYLGYDVKKAINNVNTKINKYLKGSFVFDQAAIDDSLLNLDGTKNKSNLGGNAILSVSLAVARAAAFELNIPLYEYISRLHGTKNKQLPIPFSNIINGGEHAGNNLAFQEFHIIPSAKTFEKRMQILVEVYLTLKNILKKKYGASSINVGYEGGFVPQISDPIKVLDLMQEAIDKAKYSKQVSLGLDCAANYFYKTKQKYIVNNTLYTSSKLSEYYLDLIKNYNIKSIEDPFSEDDKKAWQSFYKLAHKKIMIVGDDLLVTNPILIKQAIKKKFCNSLLLKLNQIGTLTETLNAFDISKNAGWNTIVSHRSGETEDTFIADLAYGLNSKFVKFGAPARSDRNSKYNRLLEIEAIYK